MDNDLMIRFFRFFFFFFFFFRPAALRNLEDGSVSSWLRQAPRRIQSHCITTMLTWKPSLTSATLRGIPSCEWGREGEVEYSDEVKARPLTNAMMFRPHADFISPLPLSLGGPHPPAVPPRTPGHMMRSQMRTCRWDTHAQMHSYTVEFT